VPDLPPSPVSNWRQTHQSAPVLCASVLAEGQPPVFNSPNGDAQPLAAHIGRIERHEREAELSAPESWARCQSAC